MARQNEKTKTVRHTDVGRTSEWMKPWQDASNCIWNKWPATLKHRVLLLFDGEPCALPVISLAAPAALSAPPVNINLEYSSAYKMAGICYPTADSQQNCVINLCLLAADDKL